MPVYQQLRHRTIFTTLCFCQINAKWEQPFCAPIRLNKTVIKVSQPRTQT